MPCSRGLLRVRTYGTFFMCWLRIIKVGLHCGAGHDQVIFRRNIKTALSIGILLGGRVPGRSRTEHLGLQKKATFVPCPKFVPTVLVVVVIPDAEILLLFHRVLVFEVVYQIHPCYILVQVCRASTFSSCFCFLLFSVSSQTAAKINTSASELSDILLNARTCPCPCCNRDLAQQCECSRQMCPWPCPAP